MATRATTLPSNGKPVAPEFLALAKQLGVDSRDGRLMLLVEDMARHESLPAHWLARYDPAAKRWVYTYTPSGEATGLHPCIDYYRGAVFMDSGGYRQLLRNTQARPPSQEEIQLMNQYFGIHDDEDLYIREVGQLACVAPLPEGWTEQEEDAAGLVTYRDGRSGLVLDEHPLDQYFRELRDRRRRELARRRLAAVKAMQAMQQLHRRSSAFVNGAHGSGGGEADGGGGEPAQQEDAAEAVEEEQVPAAGEAEEDPRMTALCDEWRKLQVSSGILADALGAVQSAHTPADALAAYVPEHCFPWAASATATAAAGATAASPSGLPAGVSPVGPLGQLLAAAAASAGGATAATAGGLDGVRISSAGAAAVAAADHRRPSVLGAALPGNTTGMARPTTPTRWSSAAAVPAATAVAAGAAAGGEAVAAAGAGAAAGEASGTASPRPRPPPASASGVASLTASSSSGGAAGRHSSRLQHSSTSGSPPPSPRRAAALAAAAAATAATATSAAGSSSSSAASPTAGSSSSSSSSSMLPGGPLLEWSALLQLQQLTSDSAGGAEAALAAAAGQQRQLQPQPSATFHPAVPRDEDPDGDEVYERAGQAVRAIRATVDAAAAYARLLPPDAAQALASLPKGWLDLVRRLPASWAARLRLGQWPQLLTWLPPDWVERLQAHMAAEAAAGPAGPAAVEPAAAPPPAEPVVPEWLQSLSPEVAAALRELATGLAAAAQQQGQAQQGQQEGQGEGRGTTEQQRATGEGGGSKAAAVDKAAGEDGVLATLKALASPEALRTLGGGLSAQQVGGLLSQPPAALAAVAALEPHSARALAALAAVRAGPEAAGAAVAAGAPGVAATADAASSRSSSSDSNALFGPWLRNVAALLDDFAVSGSGRSGSSHSSGGGGAAGAGGLAASLMALPPGALRLLAAVVSDPGAAAALEAAAAAEAKTSSSSGSGRSSGSGSATAAALAALIRRVGGSALPAATANASAATAAGASGAAAAPLPRSRLAATAGLLGSLSDTALRRLVDWGADAAAAATAAPTAATAASAPGPPPASAPASGATAAAGARGPASGRSQLKGAPASRQDGSSTPAGASAAGAATAAAAATPAAPPHPPVADSISWILSALDGTSLHNLSEALGGGAAAAASRAASARNGAGSCSSSSNSNSDASTSGGSSSSSARGLTTAAHLRELEQPAAAAAAALRELSGEQLAALLAAPLPVLRMVAGLDQPTLRRLGALAPEVLAALLRLTGGGEGLRRLLEVAEEAAALSPSWLDDFCDFIAARRKGAAPPAAAAAPVVTHARGTQTAPAQPAVAAAAALVATHVRGTQTSPAEVPAPAPTPVPLPPAPALAPPPTPPLPPPPPPPKPAVACHGTQTDPRDDVEARVIAIDAIASIQSVGSGSRLGNGHNGRGSGWDNRPLAPEIRRRHLNLRDRDLKAGSASDPYDDAPDELLYKSYRESDIKHLKQRIVRVEMQRSQMGAKLAAYSRRAAAQTAALGVAAAEAQRQAYELGCELDTTRAELAAALRRLDEAAAAHAELGLLAALPSVPEDLRSQLARLHVGAASALVRPFNTNPHTSSSTGGLGGLGGLGGGGSSTSTGVTGYGHLPHATSAAATASAFTTTTALAGGSGSSSGSAATAAAAAAAGIMAFSRISDDYYMGGGGGGSSSLGSSTLLHDDELQLMMMGSQRPSSPGSTVYGNGTFVRHSHPNPNHNHHHGGGNRAGNGHVTPTKSVASSRSMSQPPSHAGSPGSPAGLASPAASCTSSSPAAQLLPAFAAAATGGGGGSVGAALQPQQPQNRMLPPTDPHAFVNATGTGSARNSLVTVVSGGGAAAALGSLGGGGGGGGLASLPQSPQVMWAHHVVVNTSSSPRKPSAPSPPSAALSPTRTGGLPRPQQRSTPGFTSSAAATAVGGGSKSAAGSARGSPAGSHTGIVAGCGSTAGGGSGSSTGGLLLPAVASAAPAAAGYHAPPMSQVVAGMVASGGGGGQEVGQAMLDIPAIRSPDTAAPQVSAATPEAPAATTAPSHSSSNSNRGSSDADASADGTASGGGTTTNSEDPANALCDCWEDWEDSPDAAADAEEAAATDNASADKSDAQDASQAATRGNAQQQHDDVAYYLDNGVLVRTLGEGGFGRADLYDVTSPHDGSTQLVVVKTLRPPKDVKGASLAAALQHEAAGMRAGASCPQHVVALYACSQPSGSLHEAHQLVMEYVEGSSLEEYTEPITDQYMDVVIAAEMCEAPTQVEKWPPLLSQAQLRTLATHLLRALCVLHAHDVCHADITPGNIMMTPDAAEPGGFSYKLLDFGMARPAVGPGKTVAGEGATRDFASPEALCNIDRTCPHFPLTLAMDLANLGFVLMECAGLHGGASSGLREFREGEGGLPETWDAPFVDLIHRLVEVNPWKRITAQAALQHPFIVGESSGSAWDL
ncbi:hypothetical protein HXX76_013930 [Chlamydomonas incerta]|uniref:Protein kinase domain-containing protein n=1 Tax=Chlamydomonas incerta TaxID=51695 RepID=A0A835SGL4_CHLIN|nr:hypothetical protein HXX76_013930 [Chlamydomonas incerta]|eukprot:KAG2425176.1 hypothetical protein HXX76_013930 [Chlamydomonas incerta]